MKNGKVRVGIIGAGNIAQNQHIPAYLKQKDVELVGICDINEERAKEVAAKYNMKYAMKDYKDLLSLDEIDAVSICTWNNAHAEIAIPADSKVIKAMADAGKYGEIYFAKAGWLRRRGTPLGWFTDVSKSGGGPVIDIGVHVIDLTWYFMGKPKPISVSSTIHKKIGDYKTKGVSRWVALDTDNLVYNVEDSACGFIRFENGATMNFDVSWAINGKDTD